MEASHWPSPKCKVWLRDVIVYWVRLYALNKLTYFDRRGQREAVVESKDAQKFLCFSQDLVSIGSMRI